METSLVKAEEKARELQAVVRQAAALEIRTQSDRDAAMDFLRSVKQAQTQLNALCKPVVSAAHGAWKAAKDQQNTLVKPFEDAERRVKGKVLDYDREAQRKAAEEQRRLQAIADEQARKERERMEKAAAKLKTESLREERLAEAAAIEAPVVVAAPAVDRTQGETTRKIWKARLVSMTDLIAAAAKEVDLAHGCLAFDQTAANAIARATKGSIRIPGVEFWAEESMALRV
jgi:hypothetical protein